MLITFSFPDHILKRNTNRHPKKIYTWRLLTLTTTHPFTMRVSPLEIFGDSVILWSKSSSFQKFMVGDTRIGILGVFEIFKILDENPE